MMDVPRIEDAVVLITGGANGLGLSMVENFVKNKAKKVIIADFNEEKGRDAVKVFGDAVDFFKCDVTNKKDIDDLVKYTTEKYSGIQILINNAGIFLEVDVERTIAVNLTAVINLSYAFYELENPPHTIINTASIYGYRDMDGLMPVYQATKFGVTGFTKSLGHKDNFDKTGIRVIGLCPGMTRTDMSLSTDTSRNRPAFHFLLPKFAEIIVDTYVWQDTDAIGRSIIDIYKKATSGSMWLVEGGELKQVIQTNKEV